MIKKRNNETLVLGLMSGTSLDGLDMALCAFNESKSGFEYSVKKAKTIKYSKAFKQQLTALKDAGAEAYFAFDVQFAGFIATKVNAFLKDSALKPALIASHGHTVFHQPRKGFSTQLGSGAIIAAKTGITTVCDFRSIDVGLGGQGAPLVPIGDSLLFKNFDACLNIGGIANISFEKNGKRLAYDVCEANMLLNYLAEMCGKAYDKDGKLAASGTVNEDLLKNLNKLAYYSKQGAKSIGREWFESAVMPLLSTGNLSTLDLLATSTEHVAHCIATDLNRHKLRRVLITGGGAFNKVLIARLKLHTRCEVIIPEPEIVNFKEALIFAFLGYLRVNGKVNTLASVTGASQNSVGGAVYLG